MPIQALSLTRTILEDLQVLYQFQLDEEARYHAAFTSKETTDKQAYIDKYSKLLSDPTIHMRTIRIENEIVGSIAKFVMEGKNEITYWIDKKFWQQGIGTTALKEFLKLEPIRPIFAHTAFDNISSQRVLEKNGFGKIGTDKGFAYERQKEIEEYIYSLNE